MATFWDAPAKRVELKLQRLMGPTRYERWLAVTDRFHMGTAMIDEVYACLETLEEAAAAMSHQFSLTERTFLAALDPVQPLLGPGARIAELGCFTGATTKWLALNHPALEVVGVDRLSRRSTSPPSQRRGTAAFWPGITPRSQSRMARSTS